MIVYIILSSIIIIALGVSGYILWQKIPKLRAIDLDAMRTHKIKQVKFSIVEERLERKIKEWSAYLKKKLSPLYKFIKNILGNFYKKIVALQKQYKQREEKKAILEQEDKGVMRQKISALLYQAEELIKENRLVEAEKKYIEAIAFDKQDIEIYRGLAQLYILKKDYAHARETLEFIRQINPNDETVWRDMGQVCSLLNDDQQAVKCYKKAVDISPNNPKNLDILIEMSIKAKDRYLAESTLQKLREVNPENQKLEEYQKQIETL
jgi:tetratricopeptide (TPR) repeat protein